MSRSIKKNIIMNAECNISEKKDKTRSNKKLRTIIKVRIAKHYETLPLLKEVSNIWDFAKDGKLPWIGINKNRFPNRKRKYEPFTFKK